MLKKPNYFPQSEPEKRAWLLLFKQNLPVAGQRLGVDPNRLQSMERKVDTMIQQIDNVNQKEAELSAARQERDEDRELNMPELFDFAKEIKASSNYLQSIGEALGIEVGGSRKAVKGLPSIEKLEVKSAFKDQKVSFEFKKPRGISVIIYCRRNGEDFIQLRQVSKNTYEDARTNANGQTLEKREYRFSLIKNDVETEPSAIYPIAVIQ